MDKRDLTNLKRRLSKAAQRFDYDRHFVTEQRDVYSNRIASVYYVPGNKTFEVDFQVYNVRKGKHVNHGVAWVDQTMKEVVEKVCRFFAETEALSKQILKEMANEAR